MQATPEQQKEQKQANPLPRILVTVLFIGLLATPFVVSRLTGHKADNAVGAPGKPVDPNISLARYGFALTEVAKKSGIDFTHEAPQLDSKLDPIMGEIAAMGAAVSIVDFDKDGWNDIYVTNSAIGSKNHLYRNNHDGTFTDVADKMGLADLNQPGTGVSMGAVWGDYDGDGYEDVLVYKWGKPELFHNDGGKGFTRVTDKAGLPPWVNANSAIWIDYDRDGHLDLLICGYYPESLDLWHLKDTKMMPESFEYAKNGGRKYLLRGRGDGTFEDVTAKMGIDTTRWTLAAAAADLRGTGYPDIIFANDYGITEFYANQNGKGFREISKATNVGDKPKSGMNCSFGDILNTGKYAIYISNISEDQLLMQGNNLWIPVDGTSGENIKYQNTAVEMGVENGGWSFGAQFGDFNNDGNLDLYLTNGFISGDRGQSYWYDYSKVSGGNTEIISDAKNWPPLKGRSHAGYQRKKLWLNDGGGRFNEVAQIAGANDTYDGRSVALADLDNNGALDVIVANQKGPLLVYKNTVAPENKWIELELEGAGSNTSAIGAEVRLFWDGKQQVQQVTGGSGFCAQNQRRLHFGLGKNPHIEKLQVRWVSGKIQSLPPLEVGKIHHLKETS